MTTHYLGQTSDGRIVSRKSTNPHFTHAAMVTGDARYRPLPNFSTSAHGAARNLLSNYRDPPTYEVVELRKVDGAEYRKAMAGIDPKTGLPRNPA